MPDRLKRSERVWEKLNIAAARARAVYDAASQYGVDDRNAANLLRLQRVADAAEDRLIAMESAPRKRVSRRTRLKANSKRRQGAIYRSATAFTHLPKQLRRPRA